MAITETRALPAQFIEDLGKDYATQLTAATAAPLDTSKFAPSVAGQTALQQKATDLTTAGIGSYQPFVTAAQQAATTAGTGLGLAQTGLGIAGQELTGAGTALGTAGTTVAGAQPFIGAAGTGLTQAGTTLGGVSPFISAAGTGLGTAAGLTGTGAGTGVGSISSFMSPYQQQVIDTSLAEFDRQAAQRQQAISDQAVALGGFGGGREGVMQSEYQTQSDRNRAALQAQLQAQGFSQAQAARQADLQNQMMLSQGQLGLGQAQIGLGQAQAQQAGQSAGMAGQRAALAQTQAGFAGQRGSMAGQQAALAQGQLGLGQYQTGLGGALQGFQGTDIARAGQVGAADQAFAQANIDAQRERERMGLYEPYERLGFLGSGLTGLMGGMGPQYQFQNLGSPSPLATALGVGSTLGGIYRDVTGKGN